MWIDIIAGVATIVAAIVAIISLRYIAKQAGAVREQVEGIREQAQRMREQTEVIREQTKQNRAYEYMRRFNDPAFREIASETLNFLKKDMKETEKCKILEDPEHVDLKSKVANVLNFFEELGIMYNNDLVRKDIIKNSFRTSSATYYRYAIPILEKMRELYGKTILENWERMNDDLKKTSN